MVKEKNDLPITTRREGAGERQLGRSTWVVSAARGWRRARVRQRV